jgi:hypothetical protein
MRSKVTKWLQIKGLYFSAALKTVRLVKHIDIVDS